MPTHYQGDENIVRALDAFIKMNRAADSVFAKTSKTIREYGLTEPQFAVLEIIYHCGPQEQHAIAHKLLRTGGNITFLIDKLEQAGLVLRTDRKEDRRCYLIHLTEKGRELIARVFPGHAQAIADVFAVLEPSEQIEFSRLCKKLGRSINEPVSTNCTVNKGE